MPSNFCSIEKLIYSEDVGSVLNLGFFIDLESLISPVYLWWCTQLLQWKIIIKWFVLLFVLIGIFYISDKMEYKVLVCILDRHQLALLCHQKKLDLWKFKIIVLGHTNFWLHRCWWRILETQIVYILK